MTPDQLQKIMPLAHDRAALFFAPLVAAMQEFQINTPLRQAAFLAQIAHESCQLLYVKELASGAAYQGRKDLGDIHPVDGEKYKGRGLIQITGLNNYQFVASALKIDCVNHPELLEQPVNACRSAAWFWQTHGLNELADKDFFVTITRRINGGLNGLSERQQFYKIAKQVFDIK